jgi:hypothetical protein
MDAAGTWRDLRGLEPEAAPRLAEAPSALAPGFRNPLAVRISVLVAMVATFLGWLPFLNWLAGGFFAVVFYRRRSAGLVTLNAGVHLGWITGVIMFAMWSVVFAAMGAMGQLHNLVEQQIKNLPANDPYVQQLTSFVQSGAGLALMLLLVFVAITCSSMAGGALGAKWSGRLGGRVRPPRGGGRIA